MKLKEREGYDYFFSIMTSSIKQKNQYNLSYVRIVIFTRSQNFPYQTLYYLECQTLFPFELNQC